MLISSGYYIAFVTVEGKDERGQAIIGKSSQISFIFIAFGFIIQLLYVRFASPSLEQIQTAIFIWMALVWGSNSLSIYMLKSRS